MFYLVKRFGGFADDWKNDANDVPTSFVRKVEKIQLSPSYADEKTSPTRYRENPPSYIFPKEPIKDVKSAHKYKESYDKPYRKQLSTEDDPPIIIIKPKESDKRYREPVKSKEDERKVSGGLLRQQSERYRQATERFDYSKFDHRQYGPAPNFETYDKYERENLTDRQKYREIVEGKKYQKHSDDPPLKLRLNDYGKDERDYSPERVRTLQRKSKSSGRFDHRDGSKSKMSEEFADRNPYREPESLPYRQSIESMMKSPIMKYKSRVAYERRSPTPPICTDKYCREAIPSRKQSNRSSNRRVEHERDLYIKDQSPMSTMKKTSPKDRFQDAKEKFQAMEKIRIQQESKPALSVRRSEPSRYEKDYRNSYSPEPRYHAQNEWSSEEEFAPNVREYRAPDRHYHQRERMAPAKSLGNLAKGYRHSYAEPMKYLNCNRVGLAAISLDPY